MVGTIVAGNGGAPSFLPETGGYSDQGVDYYAAKTGGPAKLEPGSRRLLFAFNGWGGGVTEGTCGRYDVIPRELSLKEGFLHLAPIAELSAIRKNVTTTQHAAGARALLRQGSQVQAVLNCSVSSTRNDDVFPAGSNVSLEVLATADGSQLARYGFALDTRTFFIESEGLKTTSSHPQTPYPSMPPWISMVVLVLTPYNNIVILYVCKICYAFLNPQRTFGPTSKQHGIPIEVQNFWRENYGTIVNA
eukprot:COSAG03_NODE_3902_length_1766_cov_5.622675_2_plen_247_part_00